MTTPSGKDKTCGFFSKDLFPTRFILCIFVLYMALFINQGILVTASKKDGGYKYNPTIAVFLTECVKILAAICLYIKDVGISQLLPDMLKHYKVCLLYFVPAGLYCAYNNLGFINLQHFDPTTYFLLLQFRVVVTGVIFQLLFSKKLSQMQWASLIILTLGCILKEVGHTLSSPDTAAAGDADSSIESPGFFSKMMNIHLLFIVVQIFSSCFAGVYNEYLLKDTGADVHVMIQNIFMYIDSIICGLIVLFSQDPSKVFTSEEFGKVVGTPSVLIIVINNAAIGIVTSLFLRSLNSILKTFASALELMFTAILCWEFGKVVGTPSVLIIVINNAAIGIVTSLFLRSLNSILKTFASALELMFTAILCWMIFGIVIDAYTVVSILVVTAATFLYAQNPVVNQGKLTDEYESKLLPSGGGNDNNKSMA